MLAAVSLAVGYCLQRTRARLAAWLWLVVTVVVADNLLAPVAPPIRMLALTLIVAYGMKALVGVEARRRGRAPLGWSNWLAFAVVWIGMQPKEFAARRFVRWPAALLVGSIGWLLAGATTIAIAKVLYANLGSDHLGLVAAVFLAGALMVAHFGCSGIIAAVLIRMGYGVVPQFRAPWLAQSLAEFWTRRWNVGFSVMTSLVVYRPLAPRCGRAVAIMLGFLFSGVLHELICSLPVGAGYGLPSIYFVIHGIALLLEQAMQRRGVVLRGPLARIWVFAWVLLPVPLVFHRPFVHGILVPLL